ncbi:MAG: ATP-grasp domain-containing protein [Firmicutes bacterium]|nr:ATP-grasp domain-containing protein [Bacillota bacterium]
MTAEDLPIALVTDARYRTALAAIRALGRAGVPVAAAERGDVPPGDVLGFHSRYTRERLALPPPEEAEAYLAAIADWAARRPGPVVWLPAAAASMRVAVFHQDRLPPGVRTALPARDAFLTADDKAALLRTAAAHGVPVPETWARAPGETVSDFARRVRYPLVVKYRNGEALGLPPARRYAVVRDAAAFERVYATMDARQPGPVVQEYLPGGGYGFATVMGEDGEPLAAFAHRRLREYPVGGGPSSFAESVRDPELERLGLTLLRALRWRGVAMVEFKQDAAGRHRLMEVNPRFWGSLALAVAAGVNVPLAWYALAAGRPFAPVRAWPAGVRLRFLFQDALAVRDLVRARRAGPGLLLRWMWELFDGSVTDGVFQRDDPRPGWAYLRRSLRRAGEAA